MIRIIVGGFLPALNGFVQRGGLIGSIPLLVLGGQFPVS